MKVAASGAGAADGRVEFEIDVVGARYNIWYQAQGNCRLAASGDLELAMTLPVAMAVDGALELDLPVSDGLLVQQNAIQDTLLTWYPELRRAALDTVTDQIVVPPDVGPGTLACFTGGVDSFYSVLSHPGQLSGLLFVHGFDVPLGALALRRTVSQHLGEVATEIGVELIEVETNLRELLDPYVDWGRIAHGPAIVAVASALRRDYGRLLIPSSHGDRDLFAWGSHPVLDPLWSTPALRVEHDGGQLTRVQKIQSMASSPLIARHLRVCWQPGAEYNCGSCEKCLRTMMTLDMVGALAASETFPREVDLDVVAMLPVRNENDAAYLRENLELAREVGSLAQIAALEAAQRRYLAREQ